MSKEATITRLRSGEVDPVQAVEEMNNLKPKLKARSMASASSMRTYTPKSKNHRLEQYRRDKQLRETTLKNKIPFISEAVAPGFFLSQGLVLVGGVSGKGKSTLASNLIAGYIESGQDKPVTVITNEESTEAIYNRAACVLLKYNFYDFQKGKLVKSALNEVEDTAVMLADRINVVDDDAWDMTCLEDVQAVLEYAAQSDAGLVLVDYFQTVAFSRENPHMEPFQVSKKLGLYLKDYGRKVGIPIICFAQLKTQTKDSKTEFKDRVENDKTIYNHAFQAIEIEPDFDARTTKFIVHKDRFGYTQGHIIETKFVNGRYEPMYGDDI